MTVLVKFCLSIGVIIIGFVSTSYTYTTNFNLPAQQNDIRDLPGYKKLQNDWKAEFIKQKAALGIRFSCGGNGSCEGSYIELHLTVNANGQAEKYEIEGERFCLNSKGEKLRARLLLFISHYSYPPDLAGKTFLIRTGISLKC